MFLLENQEASYIYELMLIASEFLLEELSKNFEILAEVDDEQFLPFRKNMQINAFLIKRKIV